MQQLMNILSDMKESIIQKISHPYLQQYIQTPNIDEDRLLLIISMLEHHGLTKVEMEDYVVTTMLIQIALDTHEQISDSSIRNEMNSTLKLRQLNVLAGIYYSSLYYKILSGTNNLSMTRVLAEGIKDINEHKILLYHKDSEDIESLMTNIMTIESALIKKLSDYFHESVWFNISSHLLFVKRLVLEKKTYIQDGSSLFFDVLRKIVFSEKMELSLEERSDLLDICDRYIHFSNRAIEEGMQKNPFINDMIRNIWTDLVHQQHSIAKT